VFDFSSYALKHRIQLFRELCTDPSLDVRLVPEADALERREDLDRRALWEGYARILGG